MMDSFDCGVVFRGIIRNFYHGEEMKVALINKPILPTQPSYLFAEIELGDGIKTACGKEIENMTPPGVAYCGQFLEEYGTRFCWDCGVKHGLVEPLKEWVYPCGTESTLTFIPYDKDLNLGDRSTFVHYTLKCGHENTPMGKYICDICKEWKNKKN